MKWLMIFSLLSPSLVYSLEIKQGQAVGGGGSDNFGSHVATRVVQAPFGINASSGTFESSVTVKGVVVSSSGFIGGGSTFTALNVLGTPIFSSTWTTRGMEGSVIKVTTGSVASAASIVVSAANLGLSAILWAYCGEVENVNTAVTSVRLKSLTGLPANMTIFNADAINAKDFSCITVGRP